jgi:cytochrome c oxidase assembly protein subunit 15
LRAKREVNNKMIELNKGRKWIRIWLMTGLVMLFVQVIVGGITRLTGSGLSITKWEIVTGTLPPMNEIAWKEAYELYQATPQYEKINQGLSMGQFQFIYFWEYIHRLWARVMGFVFIIPFVYFYFKGYLQGELLRRMIVVFFLAALAAAFGWIMVASGLVNRPWVNAYKLSIHLGIALAVIGYLYLTYIKTSHFTIQKFELPFSAKWLKALFALILIQIFLGGIMSGMKAALVYPSWPDMNSEIVPAILFNPSMWTLQSFINYDSTSFMSALIQLLHRSTAYIIILLFVYLLSKIIKRRHLIDSLFYRSFIWMSLIIGTQVLLGILTLVFSVGQIPVLWGVLHQGVAIFVLLSILYVRFIYKYSLGKDV